MFSRIVVAVQAPDQGALDLVQQLATEGVTEVQVLHLRERELSGPIWYARESGREAGYLIEAAVFELRMAGIAAAGNVRPAIVDRVAEAILAEAEAFGADLIALTTPLRGRVQRFFAPDVAERVAGAAAVPTLVLHG